MAKQDWPSYIKKYVWDDDKTPYRVAVGRLSKKQADSELFAYVCFLAILFSVLGVIFCTPKAPQGQSYAAAFYCFTVASSAIVLHILKEVSAALYCALAPVAVLLFLLINGFRPNTAAIDAVVVVAASALVLWYSLRVVAITRRYHAMPDQHQHKQNDDDHADR